MPIVTDRDAASLAARWARGDLVFCGADPPSFGWARHSVFLPGEFNDDVSPPRAIP